MNRELKKLKKILLKANEPTREIELARALRVIFSNSNEMTEAEAYKILGGEHEYI